MKKLQKIFRNLTQEGVTFFSDEADTYCIERHGNRLYIRPLHSSTIADSTCAATPKALYSFLRKYYAIDFRKVRI